MEWMLIKTVFSLIAVLGLMVAVVFFLKKYFYGSQAIKSSLIEVEVLGQRTLQPKKSVYVLKVLESVLVVGVTDAGMQPLTELTSEGLRELQEAREAAAPTRPEGGLGAIMRGFSQDGSFAGHLQHQLASMLSKRVFKHHRIVKPQ